MVKVITYGTYDMLHHGHIRLLERAKALGDYLIVGITSDDYDKSRGKINNQQTLMERIQAIRSTGLADEILVEEYDGQKIEDIRRYEIDIFTVGSDWVGKFDYLNEYCNVVYLPRTEGISSSDVRTEKRKLRVGIIGQAPFRKKLIDESAFVNGVEIVGICAPINNLLIENTQYYETSEYDKMMATVDAVYVISQPENHYCDTKKALLSGKHVLCESPIAMTREQSTELYELAQSRGLILMDAIKTAYSTAFERLVLLSKTGKIGQIISVDAVCTSLSDGITKEGVDLSQKWNSICAWAPTALLPVFQILGIGYKKKTIVTKFLDKEANMDAFTKIDFVYSSAVASIKVAKAAKAEGDLVITGTEGYIYVPSPWWKTDYFEVRYEDQKNNKRFFYQLDGEGIRYEIVSFVKAIESQKNIGHVSREISQSISGIIDDFNNKREMIEI